MDKFIALLTDSTDKVSNLRALGRFAADSRPPGQRDDLSLRISEFISEITSTIEMIGQLWGQAFEEYKNLKSEIQSNPLLQIWLTADEMQTIPAVYRSGTKTFCNSGRSTPRHVEIQACIGPRPVQRYCPRKCTQKFCVHTFYTIVEGEAKTTFQLSGQTLLS